MLTTRAVRVLRDADRAEVEALLDRDPVASAFVAARVATHGVSRWRLGAHLWGFAPDGHLESLCYSGANLVPVGAVSSAALRAFAAMARDQGRICSSIVGPATAVLDLWADLQPEWGRARDVRPCQPLLATSQLAPVAPDPAVRRARMTDFDRVMPACVAMYTEEVGVSPLGWDGGAAYRARIAELIRAGRSYVRVDDGEVVFKAELGVVSRRVCQVQGVWVCPELRGRGIATACVAAVVADALHTAAPVVSLYVNDYNAPARAVYARCGFEQVGTFATVLF